MHEVKCPLAGKVGAVRRQQRVFFLTASLLSAIPVGCQLLAFLAVLTTPSDFPSADVSFFSVRFWPIQIVLICLSLCGGAVLNFLRAWTTNKPVGAIDPLPIVGIVLAILGVSVLFAFSMLNANLALLMLALMVLIGGAGLTAAYRVSLDLGMLEAGLLSPTRKGTERE